MQFGFTQGPTRKADRQPTSSLGLTYHLYRTDQKSRLQVLESRVRALRSGDREAVRVRGSIVHGSEANPT